MKIGTRINLTRLRSGMSPEELGAKIHKSRATVYRYESDEIDIPLSMIQKIAEALDVSPGYLAGWTDDPNQYDAKEPSDEPPATDQMKMIDKLSKLTPENRIRFDAFLDGLLAGQEKPEA